MEITKGKTRREQLSEATYQEIKETALELMREKGSSGLSLREITRRMGMSASAFYHYFPSLNDLITVLIVDSFQALGAAVAAAREEARAENQSHSEQLRRIAHRFRQWGVDYETQFQLIYGTPIAGYAAPPEVTVPYVRQIGVPVFETLVEGIQTGSLVPNKAIRYIPPTVMMHYASHTDSEDEVSILATHILNVFWQAVFGLIMLEINHHLQPTVGDTMAFFDYHIRLQLTLLSET